MKIYSLLMCVLLFSGIVEKGASQVQKYYGLKLFPNNKEILEFSKEQIISILLKEKFNLVFAPVFEGNTSYYESNLFLRNNTSFELLKFREELKSKNISFAAVCQIFYDPDIIKYRKELIPVDQFGNSEYINWQKMICPNNDRYRKIKIEVIKEVINKFNPDILSLDFIRYPSVWELMRFDTRKDSLRNFCFCDICIEKFSEFIGDDLTKRIKPDESISELILKNYFDEWSEFKVNSILSFVSEVKKIINEFNPEIKLAIHLVPWSEDKWDNAIKWLVAQDVKKLSEYVDIISPMIYIEMIGEKKEYIFNLTKELKEKSGKEILPSIQIANAYNNKKEFDYLNKLALNEYSSGVLYFDYFKLFNNLINNKK